MKTHEELIAEGYKAYEGEKIRVYWKPSLCTHATICWRSDPEVFAPARRPWVMIDDAKTEKIIRIVEACPSRALMVLRKEEGTEEKE